MFIGDIEKGTKLIVRALIDGEKVEYETKLLLSDERRMTILVKPMLIGKRRVDFAEAKNIEVLVCGASNICIKVDKIEKVTYNGAIFHTIHSKYDIDVVNKRETVRIKINTLCKIINKDIKVEARLRDVSVEGLSIIVGEEEKKFLQLNSNLTVEFVEGMPPRKVDLVVKIVRINESDEEKGKYVIGCSAVKNDSALRSFVMHLQMQEARKKRG